MPQIVFTPEGQAGLALKFDQPAFTIGRAEDSEFHVDDARVSRHQARVSLTDEGYLIENLGRNPVEIDEVAVQRQVLTAGDRIRFGDTVYTIGISSDDDETRLRPAEDPDRTVFCATWPRLAVIDGPQTGASLELSSDRVIIGRAAECALPLDDPRVSRRHVALERRDDGFHVELLSGTNTLEVNDAVVREARLYDGDRLRIDPFSLRFESARPQDRRESEAAPTGEACAASLNEATRLAPRITEQRLGPRLVLEQAEGTPKVFTLNTPRVTIGRGEQCAIRLGGDTVSRLHAAVVRREDGYFAVGLSGTNPILVNEVIVNESRLFRGDTLQVGDYLFTFASERAGDERPIETQVVVKRRGPSRIVVLATVLLMLAMVAFLLHEYVYRPWQLESRIGEARQMLARDAHDPAMRVLDQVLDADPPADLAGEVQTLMAGSVLERARKLKGESHLPDAESLIVSHLKQHGAAVETEPLWELLDEVRFAQGQWFASQDEPRKAIREYLAIGADSARYGEAQQALSALWAGVQRVKADPADEDRSVTELLRQADDYFQRKQYLTPADANAYSIYRTVLSLDPRNRVAQLRIAEMLGFYRSQGERFCQAGEAAKARVYFQRYLLIQPDDPAVRERVATCAVAPGNAAAQTTDRTDRDPGEQARARQERVRQLLDESGVESSWIMDYLFDDGEDGTAESETPW